MDFTQNFKFNQFKIVNELIIKIKCYFNVVKTAFYSIFHSLSSYTGQHCLYGAKLCCLGEVAKGVT